MTTKNNPVTLLDSIDYDTERFIEGEPFDYEEAMKVHAEFCRIREERKNEKTLKVFQESADI